ncbi:MAG: Gfo/Idh/MocA family oxidoreductase [Puniceicoccales bacterium]|nr:Gfo/Idh/MocA family oxidoreductase [Puniceicoccales bacterium]
METENNSLLTRRKFLAASALAGAGLVLAPRSLNATNAGVPSNRRSGEPINIGIVGVGAQGDVLLTSLKGIAEAGQIPFRLKAVCDIWPYALRASVRRQAAHATSGEGETAKNTSVHSYYSDVSGYGTIEDMLEKQKDLDAVFVATPDHWHAPNTIAALKAGKHVYCEKMMARTVEEARAMVRTAKETGKLLQIGHQRRSNPNYRFFFNVLLKRFQFLGRVTNANGQWNRGVPQSQDINMSAPLARQLKDDILKRAGFLTEGKSRAAAIHEFRNWRWFKAYSNGPISDLGAHQIDIFNWVFGRPRSVIAAGGNDYYSTARDDKGVPYKPREWYDNVMCIFDYDNIPGRPAGEVARAFYQVLTTTSNGGGYFETFMGDRASFKISESAANIKAFPEAAGKELFNFLVSQRLLTPGAPPPPAPSDGITDSRASAAPEGFDMASRLGQKYIHQFHIENFLQTIRGDPGVSLNCDGEHAFQSEAPIFRINEAVASGQMIKFTEADFAV